MILPKKAQEIYQTVEKESGSPSYLLQLTIRTWATGCVDLDERFGRAMSISLLDPLCAFDTTTLLGDQ